MNKVKIGNRTVGDQEPLYFIADIAANHDGDLKRAKHLIRLAKEAGADAVKFQHHDATAMSAIMDLSHSAASSATNRIGTNHLRSV